VVQEVSSEFLKTYKIW